MGYDGARVVWNSAIKQIIEAAAELQEEKNRAAAVLGPETFERVQKIVDRERPDKRAAFYGTISEAACAGEDFSNVEAMDDIAGIYARFAIRRAFGE